MFHALQQCVFSLVSFLSFLCRSSAPNRPTVTLPSYFSWQMIRTDLHACACVDWASRATL
jgi:hypothetical protein